MSRIAALAADEKLASDVVVLDVSEQLVITDCFVIASAANERQVNAIVDNVEEKLREAGHKPVRKEGTREGRWALLDYVDMVVHVQHDEERNFYALERLWKDCPVVPVDGIEPRSKIAGTPRTRPWSPPTTRSPLSDRKPHHRPDRPALDPAPARPDRVQRGRQDAGSARHRSLGTRSGPGEVGGQGAGRAASDRDRLL
ncbi:oligomerization domain protein [Rhodococcus sp. MTM3W5.2]|nr:oligomerization domain protein [Rhodococcus sp. MTM3W5.2]